MTGDLSEGIQPPKLDPPELPTGFLGEVLERVAAAVARHALAGLGWLLIGIGAISPETFGSWEEAHFAEVTGLILTLGMLAWSLAHKYIAAKELSTAIKLHPRRLTGEETTIRDVRRIAKLPGPKHIVSLLLVGVLVSQSACFFGGVTATEKFARSNQELRVYIREANTVIDALLDENAISPEAAIAIVTTLRGVNKAQKHLLEEALKYLQTDANGNEVLVLTNEGRLRLADLTLSLTTVASAVVNDPAIVTLSAGARARITAALLALPPVITQLSNLIAKLKQVKQTTQPLRLQVSAGTATSWRLVLPQLDQLDRQMAEVGR